MMDKSWMKANITTKTFKDGVKSFIDFARVGAIRGEISCPCNKCGYAEWFLVDVVHHHILQHGFLSGYTHWTFHGKLDTTPPISQPASVLDTSLVIDNIRGLVRDALGVNSLDSKSEESSELRLEGDIDGDIEGYIEEDIKEESEEDIEEESDEDSEEDIGDKDIRYKKFDVRDENGESSKSHKSNKPAEVLRYFPLILRLKRLYMSEKTTKDMRWHNIGLTKDGKLRHPADGLAWKAFDARYPKFASDPRSVRLGLASDGFNPFRTMSTSHSTWPVVLIPYNLPPWICMKQQSLILSSIIPGGKAPGDDIDIYLIPLIKELKLLWKGVDAYDAFSKEKFKLRASLLWTVNDFPAYANLSGWSTKGRVACPVCTSSTHSTWLKHGRKFCYMGHRRWLEPNHNYRSQMDRFDGTIETEGPPSVLTGSDILKQLRGTTFKYGKYDKSSKKRTRDAIECSDDKCSAFGDKDDFIEENIDGDQQLWKKRSIFFDLPYWEYNLLRHNLDVMHIEKNIFDNLLGTLMNWDGKSKDNENSRKDLKEMGIRHDLHVINLPNKKPYLPPACYSMSNVEKTSFLQVLKNLKVPDGYASNISRGVSLKDRKILNLKSHDGHILMQDILPIALRASMVSRSQSRVVKAVSDLCSFFKGLCAKVLDVNELETLEHQVVQTLCELEQLFPPSFFTIMVHLSVHLILEAKLGRPVQYRWMYPIERFLMRLKSYVRNKAQPEVSIAEGYIKEECLTFCARYFEGVETFINRPRRNDDDDEELYTECMPYNLPIPDDFNETPSIYKMFRSKSSLKQLTNKTIQKNASFNGQSSRSETSYSQHVVHDLPSSSQQPSIIHKNVSLNGQSSWSEPSLSQHVVHDLPSSILCDYWTYGTVKYAIRSQAEDLVDIGSQNTPDLI
ncbi:uncharacterized protein Tco_0414693 [Tanacetum coccineum]